MKILITFFCCVCFWSLGISQAVDSLGCTGAVGDVKWSVLAPDVFQEVNGNCWILMAGQNIASSKLGRMGFSKVPEGQGMFLRAIDMRTSGRQDPDRLNGTSPGHYQPDEFRSHVHDGTTDTDTPVDGECASDDDGENDHAYAIGNRHEPRTCPGHGHDFTTNSTGGKETRPKNIALYLYIRIN